jgi:NodT family efflux transporter outer membrane factor (OMF) lipoprotein
MIDRSLCRVENWRSRFAAFKRRREITLFHRRVCLISLISLAGCTVGPDYEKPTAPVSSTFKESKGWKVATPRDGAAKGQWWEAFKDPLLNRLEQQVEVSNQTLKENEAQYRAALALIREAQAGLFPTVTGTYTATRSRGSSFSGSGSGNPYATTFTLEGAATWDLDIWGKVRRMVESDAAAAQASAADIANVKLSMQAQLATAYFNLRATDSLHLLLTRTAASFQRTLDITQNQYKAGVAAKSDVITALTQLKTTQASAISTGILRAQNEHAIAMLTGRPPAELTIPERELPGSPPRVPLTLASELLERRPDVAGAERTMQQQNAQIGATIATFYPDISLSGVFGFVGARPLPISFANEVWSIGASAAETLAAGGLTTAQVAAARANYDASVAAYRQAVLTAFQQVEDQLSNLHVLGRQKTVQDAAVSASRQAVEIDLNEYRAGTTAFTTVVAGEATLLGNEQAALSIRQSQYLDCVALIEALGGGWNSTALPDIEELKKVDLSSVVKQ